MPRIPTIHSCSQHPQRADFGELHDVHSPWCGVRHLPRLGGALQLRVAGAAAQPAGSVARGGGAWGARGSSRGHSSLSPRVHSLVAGDALSGTDRAPPRAVVWVGGGFRMLCGLPRCGWRAFVCAKSLKVHRSIPPRCGWRAPVGAKSPIVHGFSVTCCCSTRANPCTIGLLAHETAFHPHLASRASPPSARNHIPPAPRTAWRPLPAPTPPASLRPYGASPVLHLSCVGIKSTSPKPDDR